MCQGQQQSASLGYSPMPINLVQASFDQIRKIPGVVPENISVASCNNPTFSADGHNVLADQAPQPAACDKQGSTQCTTGTGGAKNTATAVKPAASGATQGGSASSSGNATSQSGGSGSSGSGGATGTANKAASSASGAASAGTGAKSAAAGSTNSGAGANSAGSGATGGASGGGAATANDGTSADAASTGSDVAASTSCDPATGACDTGSAQSSSGGGSEVAAAPYTLPINSGWGANQTLTVIAGLLLIALVIGPGLVWMKMSDRAKKQ
jgi:hypothetical protein